MNRASVPGSSGRVGTSRPGTGRAYGERPAGDPWSEGGRSYGGGARSGGRTYGDGLDDYPGGAGGGPGGPPRGPGGRPGGRPYKGRRKPRWGRIAMVAGAAIIVIGLFAGISLYGYANGLNKDLKRTDAFSELTNGRPAKTVDGALNLLLVGSDSRDPDAIKESSSAWRADTMIIMHIPANHKSAQLVSIPRDLWVQVPESNNADCNTGSRAKINAAFAFGGLPRAVRTVECLTDVHLDHVLAIDFGGFKEVTDALGGVDLKVEQSITSIHKPYRKFTKGTMHMDGAQALDWIRQRKQFPRGDFARMQHQQEFLKALMDKAASSGTLTNPAKLNSFLKAVTNAITADKDFSLTDMALQFRNLRGNNLKFFTSPNKGSETIEGQSVVVSDRENALALYKAMAADKMDEWMAANGKKSSNQAGG
ncbi:LytR family transcriptional attenuator [Couchioplanes caeruleus]|uniref:Transcriptional regulator n=3 Tax=Couchioplanes caeruleus TaxID=56438 RepID=A0A1K0FLX4_9ACTN|nr:LCP family protein [Couchioplanes caeruleus]OJF13847.1 transcriptional regulator [Couchioplanes caeruleus subsp. caeruleus]ROP31197.1 LytR family transcriptional attenuator [Couchioplanes caeruleus]